MIWTQLTGQIAGGILSGGAIAPVPLTLTVASVRFGDYDLDCFVTRNFHDGINFEMSQFKIPRADGNVLESKYFRQTQFTLSILIQGTDAEDFQSQVDDLYEKIHGVEDLLYFKRADGEIRQIDAVGDISVESENHYNITWQRFRITFSTFGDFWYSNTSQSYTNNITASGTGFVSNDGNVTSLPQAYFIFNSAAAVTSVSFTMAWVNCTYTGAIATGDVLCFDSLNRQVTLNGAAVDYTGTPQQDLDPGTNSWETTITGTFNVDLLFIYRQNYKNV